MGRPHPSLAERTGEAGGAGTRSGQEGDAVEHEALDLLTVREVARQLRVDDTTVRRWIKTGALEAITLPHRGRRQAYRIRRSTLEALLTTSPLASSPSDRAGE